MTYDSAPSDEIRRFEQQYRQNPDSLVFARLADAWRKAGEPERALEILERGIDRHDDYLSGHLVRARTLRDLGREAEAMESFRRVLDLDAQNFVAVRELADLTRAAGRREEARTLYERLLQLDPGNEEAAANLADLSAGEDTAGEAWDPHAGLMLSETPWDAGAGGSPGEAPASPDESPDVPDESPDVPSETPADMHDAARAAPDDETAAGAGSWLEEIEADPAGGSGAADREPDAAAGSGADRLEPDALEGLERELDGELPARGTEPWGTWLEGEGESTGGEDAESDAAADLIWEVPEAAADEQGPSADEGEAESAGAEEPPVEETQRAPADRFAWMGGTFELGEEPVEPAAAEAATDAEEGLDPGGGAPGEEGEPAAGRTDAASARPWWEQPLPGHTDEESLAGLAAELVPEAGVTDGDADTDVDRDADMLTRTMADLYAEQGLYEEAEEIYEELLRDRPGDASLQEGLEAVRRRSSRRGGGRSGDEAPVRAEESAEPAAGESVPPAGESVVAEVRRVLRAGEARAVSAPDVALPMEEAGAATAPKPRPEAPAAPGMAAGTPPGPSLSPFARAWIERLQEPGS